MLTILYSNYSILAFLANCAILYVYLCWTVDVLCHFIISLHRTGPYEFLISWSSMLLVFISKNFMGGLIVISYLRHSFLVDQFSNSRLVYFLESFCFDFQVCRWWTFMNKWTTMSILQSTTKITGLNVLLLRDKDTVGWNSK